MGFTFFGNSHQVLETSISMPQKLPMTTCVPIRAMQNAARIDELQLHGLEALEAFEKSWGLP